jgi:hypothetical protein
MRKWVSMDTFSQIFYAIRVTTIYEITI